MRIQIPNIEVYEVNESIQNKINTTEEDITNIKFENVVETVQGYKLEFKSCKFVGCICTEI